MLGFTSIFGRRRAVLPIVVISYNRGAMLRKVIASYRLMAWPTEIFVHDNGSDDPDTIAILAGLEKEGVTVIRAPAIQYADDLNLVDLTVQKIFKGRTPTPYAVTDCDVDLSTASPCALAVYLALLRSHPEAECVGPMLTVADIQRSYPLFNRVMNIHIDHFWKHNPLWTNAAGQKVAYLPAPIDTTFAIHRAGEPFRRLKNGIRVYAPFEARHLDWYLSDERSGDYHSKSSAAISHWNNKDFLAEHAATPLAVKDYVVVRKVGRRYEPVSRTVFDNPE
jgi:glycosyltransferase involved in cell wall biosynthesis